MTTASVRPVFNLDIKMTRVWEPWHESLASNWRMYRKVTYFGNHRLMPINFGSPIFISYKFNDRPMEFSDLVRERKNASSHAKIKVKLGSDDFIYGRYLCDGFKRDIFYVRTVFAFNKTDAKKIKASDRFDKLPSFALFTLRKLFGNDLLYYSVSGSHFNDLTDLDILINYDKLPEVDERHFCESKQHSRS